MNRIEQLFERKKEGILNVYFTAGFPELDRTVPNIVALAEAGVDLIEVGMPYSDPLADGPTIQASNQRALDNGMKLKLLLEQVGVARTKVDTPLILMGYFNQVMQYGVADFVKKCSEIGVDGLILPDLPLDVFENEYAALFEKYNMGISFLISPNTSQDRIHKIDALSRGFIYMVSSSSITGKTSGLGDKEAYFQRIKEMGLATPRLIGFGISKQEDFDLVCQYASGAVVGSAYIRALENGTTATDFVRILKTGK